MTSKGEGDEKQSRVGVGIHPRWQFKILTSEGSAKSVMHSKIIVSWFLERSRAGQPVTPFKSVKSC